MVLILSLLVDAKKEKTVIQDPKFKNVKSIFYIFCFWKIVEFDGNINILIVLTSSAKGRQRRGNCPEQQILTDSVFRNVLGFRTICQKLPEWIMECLILKFIILYSFLIGKLHCFIKYN